jgi:hypothetical protein
LGILTVVQPISEANAQLPGPEREVLALLADSGLRYARVGELLGVDARTIAEIAARARLRLAHGRLPELPPACLEELPYLAAGIDGDALGPADREHPRDCPVCRENLDAMRAADAAYRAWMPGTMPDGLHDRIRAEVQGVLDRDDA